MCGLWCLYSVCMCVCARAREKERMNSQLIPINSLHFWICKTLNDSVSSIHIIFFCFISFYLLITAVYFVVILDEINVSLRKENFISLRFWHIVQNMIVDKENRCSLSPLEKGQHLILPFTDTNNSYIHISHWEYF